MKIKKDETYIICEIGNSQVSKLIQKHSEKEALMLPELIRPSTDRLPSHVAALHNGWVYQSHYKVEFTDEEEIYHCYRGVHKLPFELWLKHSCQKNDFFMFQYDLDVDMLEHYVEHNPGYGKLNIGQFLAREKIELLLGRPLSESWDRDPGLICSEYLAVTDYRAKLEVAFNLDGSWLIKPVHWLVWAYLNSPENIISKKSIMGECEL